MDGKMNDNEEQKRWCVEATGLFENPRKRVYVDWGFEDEDMARLAAEAAQVLEESGNSQAAETVRTTAQSAVSVPDSGSAIQNNTVANGSIIVCSCGATFASNAAWSEHDMQQIIKVKGMKTHGRIWGKYTVYRGSTANDT